MKKGRIDPRMELLLAFFPESFEKLFGTGRSSDLPRSGAFPLLHSGVRIPKLMGGLQQRVLFRIYT